MEKMSVAIIGGGPGGLMTAYLLQKRLGDLCETTIFEASDRLGGKIMTRSFASAAVPYEAGAAELYDYSQLGPDPLRELIAEFGLDTRPMYGPTVVLDDRILTTDDDILRHCGEATLQALQIFRRKARSSISPADYYESDWNEDNRDRLLRRTFRALLGTVPDETARRYLQVAVHSDLATEPHLTNAVYGLQNYLMNEPDYMQLYTIVGGIERLMEELIKRLTAKVSMRRRVVRVEKTPTESYLVTTRHKGEIASDEFDFVVAALPNNYLPAIDWVGGPLAQAMHRHHTHYDYPAHYLRVSVLFDKPFWRDRIDESFFMSDAFGGCCVYDESSRVAGCTHGVLGWLLGGDSAVTMSNLDDNALIAEVLDSLPKSLQHGRELFREGRVHRWLGCVNGVPGGIPMREPDSRHVPEPVENPWLFVAGDYLFDSTLNGVLDSADVVVEWIREEIEDTLASSPDGGGTAAT